MTITIAGIHFDYRDYDEPGTRGLIAGVGQ
jgi:hypothetical protein